MPKNLAFLLLTKFAVNSAMQVPFLDLSRIHDPIKEELNEVFQRVLEESYFVYGKDVTAFEAAFAAKHQVAHCVTTGNCTDALQLTLQAMGIGPGDEVIVPAMTWITDAEVVSNIGGRPVFVDVGLDGLVDVSQIEANISSHTKAIIVVHLYGQVVDMEAIAALAKKYQLKVIEDCAQATFASSKGALAGSFGDAAVFSFYPTKNLGALGDAGCLLTKDKDLALQVRKSSNHGAADKHSHEFAGTNSRMDTLQAAVLNLKMPMAEEWNRQRQKAAAYYLQELAELDMVLPRLAHHIFHVFSILCEKRDSLKQHLKTKGIQTQIHYPRALPFTQAYSLLGAKPGDFPIAYKLQNESLSLPLFPGITEQEQAYVVAQIKTFFCP